MKKYLLYFLGHSHPIKYFIAHILRFTGLCRFFTIHREHYDMKFFPTNLSAATRTNTDYRKEDLELLRKILKTGDTFVDIGANIGTICLEGAYLVGDTGKVYAFEPTISIYNYLLKNIHLNGSEHITTFNLALGDEKKIVSFASSHADTMNKVGVGGEQVQMDMLDNVLPEGVIDFMKVDVEGYEKFVFLGGKRVLQKTKVIYFEAIESMYSHYNYSTKDVLQLLESYGFSIYGHHQNFLYPIGSHFLSKGMNLLALRDKDEFIANTPYTLY